MNDTVKTPELRAQLVHIRQLISELVPNLAKYRTERVNAKTALKLATAKAKIQAMSAAKTKEEKTPTMINAVADLLTEREQKAYDLAETMETAIQLKLDALEEECKAIKKAMSSIETEMRTFGG